jgi:hypothetical protein
MKKIVGLSLATTILVLMASSASAQMNARSLSPADHAFIASLSAPERTPVAKAPTARRGQQKALCAAAASCGSYSISCSGFNSSTSCSAVDRNCAVGQRGRVTCDGKTTWCDPCPLTCWDREQSCASGCYPCDYDFSCDEETGDYNCHCRFATCPV